MRHPPPVGDPGSLQHRLVIFSILLGLCLLPPLAILLWQQHRLVLSNVTVVEELRWLRNNVGVDPPGTRACPSWKSYAPHDKGSNLSNLLAFLRAGRQSIDGKRN